MPRTIFIDTWGWIALGHRRDARHDEIKRYYQQLRTEGTRIISSDYVLDEMMTLLFRRESFPEALRFTEAIFSAAEQQLFMIERITSFRFAEAWKLRQRFQDKPLISFTDFTSMVVMKELGVTEILTEDDHFIHVGIGFRKVP